MVSVTLLPRRGSTNEAGDPLPPVMPHFLAWKFCAVVRMHRERLLFFLGPPREPWKGEIPSCSIFQWALGVPTWDPTEVLSRKTHLRLRRNYSLPCDPALCSDSPKSSWDTWSSSSGQATQAHVNPCRTQHLGLRTPQSGVPKRNETFSVVIWRPQKVSSKEEREVRAQSLKFQLSPLSVLFLGLYG